MITSISTLRTDAARLRALAEKLEATAEELEREFPRISFTQSLGGRSEVVAKPSAKLTLADRAIGILSKSPEGMTRGDILEALRKSGVALKSVDSLSSALSRSEKLQCVDGRWKLLDNEQLQTSRDTGGATQERREPNDTSGV